MPTNKTKVRKPKVKGSSFMFRWWMAAVLVIVIAVVGVVVVRFSEAGDKAYTIGELDSIYLEVGDNPRRVGPYPDPRSPKGREVIIYKEDNGKKSWNAGCFVALSPEGARALSSKFGNPAHFTTRRWFQTSCDF